MALARSENVDAVIVANDVYDRSVPPADAVALLDEVLANLVIEARTPVKMIAGNHDGAERIDCTGPARPPHFANAASAGTSTVGKASALSSTEAPLCSSSMAILDPSSTALSVAR